MTTTTFLLVRHAVHGLLPHTLAGRTPGVELSGEGRAQADRLATRLAEEFPQISVILSSPRERARQTAEPLAASLGLPVETEPAWDELDYGGWTGRRFEELAADPRWHQWNAHRAGATVPGGETMLMMQARVVTALDRWRVRQPGGTVAVFSHAEPIRGALLHALGIPPDLFWRLEISPASLSVLTLDEGGPRVLRLNA